MMRWLKKCFRRRWQIAGVVAFLLLISILAAWHWAERLLMVEHRPVKADAILLLGGEHVFRQPRALEIYQQGLAPVIIASGVGDTEGMVRWLKEQGVPETALQIELHSHSTQENAKFTLPMLHALGAKRVIIVTSWFHSRRALAVYRKGAPDLEFISLPTVADRPSVRGRMLRGERWRVLYEYIKVIGYRVVYGVNSF
jgi:uncharacterized SAM-binding protein YcdF (DUF218 family)